MEDREIVVLDKGFVHLVEHMGGDRAVVQAARVSYKSDGLGDPAKDRKLIAYLLEHDHGTPFEHAVLKFHVKAPIFVARQWFRHRMSCLDSETVLHFDLPKGVKRGSTSKYTMTVGDIFRKWQPTNNKRKARQKNPTYRRDRIKKMLLRNYDEATGAVLHTHIRDIAFTGFNDVFEVRLRNGCGAIMTETHRCLTDRGWMTLANARAIDGIRFMSVRSHANPQRFIASQLFTQEQWKSVPGFDGPYEVSTAGRCRSYKMTSGRPRSEPEIKIPTPASTGRPVISLSRGGFTKAFQVGELVLLTHVGPKPTSRYEACHGNDRPWDNRLENLRWALPIENRADALRNGRLVKLSGELSPIMSIRRIVNRATYDIAVDGPWHNFVAGGMVVHNSYNETSFRYREAPDEFYIPERWRSQDKTNKQGSVSAEFNHEVVSQALKNACEDAMGYYRTMVENGIAREMARMVLPVNLYTEFYWTVNARALMHFIGLRSEAHAQWEIREYSNALWRIFREIMPWSAAAFLSTIDIARYPGLTAQTKGA